MEKRILKAKSRLIMREHEEALKAIREMVIAEASDENVHNGSSTFQIAKKVIYNAGIKEGTRRFLAKLIELGSQNEQQRLR